MIFQLIASMLMIITLEVYHGYTKDDPDQLTIFETLKNKDIAVVLLYISRFLSGWSAGKKTNSNRIEEYFSLRIGMCCVVSTIYLMEISPRMIRGEIITFHQLFVVVGILVGQIVGIPWLLGRHK
jgi:MFS family permease